MGLLRHTPLGRTFGVVNAPKDYNSVGVQGGNLTGISLRNHSVATCFIAVGAHSSTAVAVTLQQMKNVEASGAKALGFTTYYSLAFLTSPTEERDMWQEQTASSNTFNIAANTLFAIPIKQAMLDVTNNFDCVRLHTSAPGASTLIFAWWELEGGPEGIAGSNKHRPSVHVNRMDN